MRTKEQEEILACFEPDALGRGVSRSKAHEEGILHGASHIFIRKWEDGKLFLLLQRRSESKDSFPGCLDVSSAGHVELGSDFLRTALREMSEELGIFTHGGALCHLFDRKVECRNVFWGKPFIDREVNRVYLFLPEPDIAELELQQQEVSEVLWVPADEVLTALRQGDPAYCLDLEEVTRAVGIIMNKESPAP